nr:heme chaperone HemW-like [Ziziphus jujuba var. spinosa]
MLKSTFAPIFSAFPAKPRTPHPCSTAVFRVFAHNPSTVRQNTSTNSPTCVLPPYLFPPTSAYVHLPFCRKRCHYCDFPIVALGSASTQTDDDPRIVNYIQLISREVNATRAETTTNPPLETVFFGGGTPSLVPPRLVSSILETLRLRFGLSLDAECNGMDPGTFDAKKMRANGP